MPSHDEQTSPRQNRITAIGAGGIAACTGLLVTLGVSVGSAIDGSSTALLAPHTAHPIAPLASAAAVATNPRGVTLPSSPVTTGQTLSSVPAATVPEVTAPAPSSSPFATAPAGGNRSAGGVRGSTAPAVAAMPSGTSLARRLAAPSAAPGGITTTAPAVSPALPPSMTAAPKPFLGAVDTGAGSTTAAPQSQAPSPQTLTPRDVIVASPGVTTNTTSQASATTLPDWATGADVRWPSPAVTAGAPDPLGLGRMNLPAVRPNVGTPPTQLYYDIFTSYGLIPGAAYPSSALSANLTPEIMTALGFRQATITGDASATPYWVGPQAYTMPGWTLSGG